MTRIIAALAFVSMSPPSCADGLALPRRSHPAPPSGGSGGGRRRHFRRKRTTRGSSSIPPPPVAAPPYSLFTVNEVLPPLDSTALPAVSPRHGGNSTDTDSDTLFAPYSQRFESSELLRPLSSSLRQRDDPDDRECQPHVCGPLPVTYTNSPAVVERWLEDNVPSHPTFLGFDLEVRRCPS